VWTLAMSDLDLRALLETLDPKARDDLRRASLIRGQADRDAICRLDGWPASVRPPTQR
jgi:hypothetical protein